MKEIKAFLKKILLAVELVFVIAFVHWDKFLFVGIIALDQFVFNNGAGRVYSCTAKCFSHYLRTESRRGVWNPAQPANIFSCRWRNTFNFGGIFLSKNQSQRQSVEIWRDNFGRRRDCKFNRQSAERTCCRLFGLQELACF